MRKQRLVGGVRQRDMVEDGAVDAIQPQRIVEALAAGRPAVIDVVTDIDALAPLAVS